MNSIQYQRLKELNSKINSNVATREEKDEYVHLLFKNKSITQQQYNDYLKKDNSNDDLMKIILLIGAFALLVYALSDKRE
ncbi:hypothetical protein [Capnocytophaga catalasegens]|uniref:Uncharacterized protein n=1 Tax=Capnocytophaga catalasegens TaxID=1004260 RepID=A0AAV5AVG9_9FLAO|nr:hypothetical protein [Capnocytophaga catalasegens]GIZ15047.1 hypothetical protein RCZ03_10470 [Capnocytophaga catalasegens]GJM49427.1 hypothetical protein RCZ15_04020 [Capnocytophaga catalasegens]GJM52577.1 hypothetical protein RCZ16_08940 [Capnocytophaga catalasegens]